MEAFTPPYLHCFASFSGYVTLQHLGVMLGRCDSKTKREKECREFYRRRTLQTPSLPQLKQPEGREEREAPCWTQQKRCSAAHARLIS